MKLLNVLISLLVCTTLLAQSPTVKWGGMEKIGGNMDSYIPLGKNGHNYYAIQIDKKDGRLINVDKSMNIASQKEIITGQKKFEADLAILRNGEVMMFTSEYEKKANTNFVRVTTFDLNGKVSKTKYKKIAAVRVEKNNHRNDFDYYFSQDTSVLLMMHIHDTRNKDDVKISFTVTNLNDYSEIWEGTTTLPYESRDFTAISAAVEPTGNVILVATIKGDKGKRLEKYASRIFSFKNSPEYSDAEFKLEGKFISSARIEHSPGGKLMVTGFYNDLKKGKNEGIEGAFIGSTNAEYPENIELTTFKIDPRTKNSITHTSGLAKLFQGDELNAYNITKFNINPDGSGYVIAEQRKVVEHKSSRSVSRTYYFNHLIIYRFNGDSQIEWISAIPKLQSTVISTPVMGIGPVAFWFWPSGMVRYAHKYNSFVSMEKNGNIYILYNDHNKNGNARTIKDVKMMNNKKAAQATLVTIEPDGKWAKDQLFRGKDVGVILETSSSYVLGEDKFIISAERGKKLQYGELAP